MKNNNNHIQLIKNIELWLILKYKSYKYLMNFLKINIQLKMEEVETSFIYIKHVSVLMRISTLTKNGYNYR